MLLHICIFIYMHMLLIQIYVFVYTCISKEAQNVLDQYPRDFATSRSKSRTKPVIIFP